MDLAARDASACSKHFKELRPDVKDFSERMNHIRIHFIYYMYIGYPPNYSQRDRLLCLTGTIPVNIRGKIVKLSQA